MSEVNVKNEFAQFGKYCLMLAVLSLIVFIFSIGAMFISVLQYVNWILQVAIIIVFILALMNISKAANTLKNDNLLGFRNKLIIALILGLVGGILIGIGIAVIIATAVGPNPGSPAAVSNYVTFGVLVLIGLICLIVSVVLEILAWGQLKRFFTNNMTMFPEDIGRKAKSGAFLCQLSAIFVLTIILAFIGFIIRVIGLFKLSALKELK